jgi:Mg/Co/Ni transporter MgtE
VVALFQGTLDKLIILAPSCRSRGPVGQHGCQALAVTIAASRSGDIKPGGGGKLVSKEALLGFANGIVTGVLCGVAMYLLARLAKLAPRGDARASW